VLVGASADGPTDVDGWQYHHDFSTRSLSSPNPRRCVLFFFLFSPHLAPPPLSPPLSSSTSSSRSITLSCDC
jgi:hypothetical protein